MSNQTMLTSWLTPNKRATTKKKQLTPEQLARMEANRQAALTKLNNSPLKAKVVQSKSSRAPPRGVKRSHTEIDAPRPNKQQRGSRSARASKKQVSYVEDEDSDDDFTVPRSRKRTRKRAFNDDDDDFHITDNDLAEAEHDENDDVKMADVLPESDEEVDERPRKRRRISPKDRGSEDEPILPSRRKANVTETCATEPMDEDKKHEEGGLEDMGKFTQNSGVHVERKQPKNMPSFDFSGENVGSAETSVAPAARRSVKVSKKDVRGEAWYQNPKDHSKRTPDDPEYNPSQLYIPESAYPKMTPGHAQYWRIKSNHNDGILFFKVGKFYELFFKDAEIGHEIVGLDWMNDDIPHVGFPEQSFDKYAESFVKYGYRVYRIEQMETSQQQKAARRKTVKREICQVLTKGTLSEMELIGDADANFLLAIVEDEKEMEIGSCSLGVCFVDCGTGQFHVGSFHDDRSRSRLRTLLVQIRPNEIIFKRDQLGTESVNVLKTEIRDALRTPLVDGLQFWGIDAGKAHLVQKKDESEQLQWWEDGRPQFLEAIWEDNLCMSAVSGILGYLHSSMLDELSRNSQWIKYDPIDRQSSKCLVLDGPTLTNLEILENEDGGVRGTLFEFINKTATAFGRRMLRQWLRQPLCQVSDIETRLEAVEYLMSDECGWNEDIRDNLKKIPDLPRLLSRISALGCQNRKMDEAVMFEDIWKSRKIAMFTDTLDGLKAVADILEHIRGCGPIPSPLVSELVSRGGRIPDFEEVLEKFRDAFDLEKARKTLEIEPVVGMDEEFDDIMQKMGVLDNEFDQILSAAKKKMGCRVVYYDPVKSKDKRQLEVPDEVIKSKGVPGDWTEMSKTKAKRRYHTPKIVELLEECRELREDKHNIVLGYTRKMFAKFAKNASVWRKIVDTIAELDCLLSLALTSQWGENMSRPQFFDEERPFLELRGASHPCVATAGFMSTSSQYIPNDTVLGCEENNANFVIVTGPNMGGKSTLLRQTCVNVILAHVGCYVPASLCRLTPVDRIFTRVGANDRILAGQSTFMVELEETSNILRHATTHSLVILDELGRGTSTFDGTSIASAVAERLIYETKCRTLFSTHYHGLCETFNDSPEVGMYHMAFQEQNGHITFLYKFTQGICSDSHGVHCARLAGLPGNILQRATEMGEAFRVRVNQSTTDQALLEKFDAVMGSLIEDDDDGFRRLCGGSLGVDLGIERMSMEAKPQ